MHQKWNYIDEMKGFFCWHYHTTSHSTTPHPMNRARRWHTVVTLPYDLCYWSRHC